MNEWKLTGSDEFGYFYKCPVCDHQEHTAIESVLPEECPNCKITLVFDSSMFVDKKELHKQVCDKMHDTYIRKNADYGDSFARVRHEEGQAAILVRLKDKLYRLETLLHGGIHYVNDESVDDTLLDLANYCIMELVERGVEYGSNRRHQDSSPR